MKKEIRNYFKLGLFVLAGGALFAITLYLIGMKRNVFSATIKVNAVFFNVNGLIPGNNVRYGGLDVGTVDEIIFQSDTGILVKMIIENKLKGYIKRNTLATIGTDGLVGNKLVNLVYVDEYAPELEAGDTFKTIRPLETDDMMRTLNQTNQNLLLITTNLKNISNKLNQKNNLFDLLDDKSIAQDIKQTFSEFRNTAAKARVIADNANSLIIEFKNGKGLMGNLLRDTSTNLKIKAVMINLEKASDSLRLMSHQLNTFSRSLNSKSGLLSTVTKDTSIAIDLKETVSNINQSTLLLNENLKALQSNWFFKSYFKKKQKEAAKALKK